MKLKIDWSKLNPLWRRARKYRDDLIAEAKQAARDEARAVVQGEIEELREDVLKRIGFGGD